MHPTDDNALLREFAENRSDEAFAELVKRHVNLVYSVALRNVGDPHHAGEIAQRVFIILAQKAPRLRHEKALSSWLFQATQLTANNFVRSEARRHRREQEAYMQSVIRESDPGEVWQQIAPFLDDAVAALGPKDRSAIVLRFYEGRNLREVGAALGANEGAAKMRVIRALEKLQKNSSGAVSSPLRRPWPAPFLPIPSSRRPWRWPKPLPPRRWPKARWPAFPLWPSPKPPSLP